MSDNITNTVHLAKLVCQKSNQRWTIQALLCAVWREYPGLTDEQVSKAVKDEFADKTTYGPQRVARDRRRYNTADFPCMRGIVPERPAYDPEVVKHTSSDTTGQLHLGL